MKKYRIIGTLYDEIPKYWKWDKEKISLYFTKIKETQWIITAENIKEAKIWFSKNYPEYYMGGSITCIDGGTEVAIMAAPNCEYGVGNFETVEARKNFIRSTVFESIYCI